MHSPFCSIQCGKTAFILTLASGRNIWGVLQTPFIWTRNSSGKRSRHWKVCSKNHTPSGSLPLSIPTNGETVLSCTKTSQARPFLHTRQKNAQATARYCHRRCSGCLGGKGEMTGTTIRLPYLEKRAQTVGGCAWWSGGNMGEESCEQMQSSLWREPFCWKTMGFLK